VNGGTNATYKNRVTGDQTIVTPPPVIPANLAGAGVFTDTGITPGGLSRFTIPPPSSGTAGISLEPTVLLDQRARYLQHLQEIRRINEGDDTADSPGYSLNLVRIPVSILTGQKTRKGHAAEITCTIKPYLSDELLPSTFRQLVINDVIDTIGNPLLQTVILENRDRAVIEADNKSLDEAETLEKPAPAATGATGVHQAKFIQIGDQNASSDLYMQNLKSKTIMQKLSPEAQRVINNYNYPVGKSPNFDEIQKDLKTQIRNSHEMKSQAFKTKQLSSIQMTSSSNIRKARLPIPPSQLRSVGTAKSAPLPYPLPDDGIKREELPTPHPEDTDANLAIKSLADSFPTLGLDKYFPPKQTGAFPQIPEQGKLILDFQKLINEEISAAYDLLSCRDEQIEHMIWYSPNCLVEQIESAIRRNNAVALQDCHEEFQKVLTAVSGLRGARLSNATPLLAWAVLVESALLNERMHEDLRETMVSKGCGCGCNEKSPFYGPRPPIEARRAFQEYVMCRWPIHVFALDPVNQEQNVADSYFMKRELQLALSLSFASGKINAQSMTQYARKIEMSMDTVALNRTVVGFSHGDDTFGWRFFPRVQTPDIESNATVCFRDMLIGGPSKDALKKDYELEQGMRECTAIVIMPSFVPYVTIDTRSNWFSMVHPKQSAMSMEQTMELSRAIRAMHQTSTQVARSDLYRDGELPRLMQRVHQLDRELPLQSMTVQVPYENTLGGFEMFSGGISALAPELIGWYGEPGVIKGQDAQIILFGDHFSVHDTTVIAGNRQISEPKLISRRMMLVNIPKDAQISSTASSTAKNEKFPCIDIHVMTPYGVTGHLLVPVTEPKETPPEEPASQWQPKKLTSQLHTTGHNLLVDGGKVEILVGDTVVPRTPVHLNCAVHYDGNLVQSFTIQNIPYNIATKSFQIQGAHMQFLADAIADVRIKNTLNLTKPLELTGTIAVNGLATNITGSLQIEMK
jgi:hypothetical protein